MAEQARTIVEYFAEHEAYRCGYCGKSDTNFSHGNFDLNGEFMLFND